jgi:hypothetical protein
MGFWDWVQGNHEVLQTLAAWAGILVAVGGVIVAIAYAILTRKLADAANDQASASKAAAEASRRGAEAAAAQARTTQQIFEAAHRPYVEVWLDSGSFWTSPEFFRLYVKLKNHGPVPADIIRWQAVFRIKDEIVGGFGPADELLSVFPDREQTLEGRVGVDAPEGQPPGPMEVELNIKYRGAHDAEFVTNAIIRGQSHQWRLFTSHAE